VPSGRTSRQVTGAGTSSSGCFPRSGGIDKRLRWRRQCVRRRGGRGGARGGGRAARRGRRRGGGDGRHKGGVRRYISRHVMTAACHAVAMLTRHVVTLVGGAVPRVMAAGRLHSRERLRLRWLPAVLVDSRAVLLARSRRRVWLARLCALCNARGMDRARMGSGPGWCVRDRPRCRRWHEAWPDPGSACARIGAAPSSAPGAGRRHTAAGSSSGVGPATAVPTPTPRAAAAHDRSKCGPVQHPSQRSHRCEGRRGEHGAVGRAGAGACGWLAAGLLWLLLRRQHRLLPCLRCTGSLCRACRCSR